MQMSDFRLQIVHAKDGRVVSWRPGAQIETDLVEALAVRLRKRGVGMFRSEATVLAVLGEEFAKMLHELKAKV